MSKTLPSAQGTQDGLEELGRDRQHDDPREAVMAQLTAFDRGRKAGQEGDETDNPYAAGSTDHRNWELGRGFGARDAVERRDFKAMRPEASAPDHDEIED